MDTLKSASVRRAPSFVLTPGRAVLAVMLCAPCALAQTTYHVAPCGDDAWTGAVAVCAAPDGPKRTIQAAIDASEPGDTVLVADGVYSGPGNRDMDYGGRAITVRSAGGAGKCVIDCEGSLEEPHRAFFFHSGEVASSVLEGFTIRNGSAILDNGGAVLCDLSIPEIRSCNFENNAAYRGGAVYSFNIEGEIRLIGCTFTGNTAHGFGGAIYLHPAAEGASSARVEDCTFSKNTAVEGGGAVQSTGAGRRTYVRCSLVQNSMTEAVNGGGAARSSGGPETWTNCDFMDNSSARHAGGLWINGDGTITGCKFIRNSAADGGGGFVLAPSSHAALTNCLFVENTNAGTSRPGAAVWVGDGFGGPSNATIVNCTFVGNAATANGAALVVTQTSTVSASNCILWGNIPAQMLSEPDTIATLSFSDIQGGWSGDGSDNIDADPLFVDAGKDDYHLAPFSPCIDTGSNAAVPAGIDTDLGGLPRFVDDRWMPNRSVPPVDMGAYEFQGENSCRADHNNDGVLNSQDFFDFLVAFFDLAVDFNGDGVINSQDFFDYLAVFFAGC